MEGFYVYQLLLKGNDTFDRWPLAWPPVTHGDFMTPFIGTVLMRTPQENPVVSDEKLPFNYPNF